MRRVTARIAVVLLLAFAAPARAQVGPEHYLGVISKIDVVGRQIEVRTIEASGRSRRLWFRDASPTEILVAGRPGTIGDLQVGEEVSVTYVPTRGPHRATRLEVG